MGQFAFDVDAGTFPQVVLEGSRQTPVVVDFWAPWCNPCRVLKPLLEKLAEEYQGKFILAKVDSDQNQAIAAQYGVRGIPSVKAFVDGRIVDEFSGALPESQVREFLQRLIPSRAEELRRAAGEARAAGAADQALQLLAEASRLEAGNEAVRLDAADLLLELGELDEAKRLLDSLSPATREQDATRQLLAKWTFAQGSGGDEAALRDRIAARPEDMQPRQDLANLLIAQGRHQEGLEQLLEMVRINRAWNDDAPRKSMLAVFNLLGAHPLVPEFRRRLASALN